MKQIHDQKKDNNKLKTMANKWLVLVIVFVYPLSCSLFIISQREIIEVDFSPDKTFRIQKINAFFMCIWLIAYYEYYQKNVSIHFDLNQLCLLTQVKSECLSKAINEQLEKYISDKVIKLIISFLNKDLVHKHPDFDISSHSCTGHVDPIYNFFFFTGN